MLGDWIQGALLGVSEMNPEEQGLKLRGRTQREQDPAGLRDESRRTRIETFA